MDFIPRPTGTNPVEGYQFTVESREFVVGWTGGAFHGGPNPREWRLVLHLGDGVEGAARLGQWIMKRDGYYEILTCEELYRRFDRLDRPGNPHDRPANPKPVTV